MEALEEEERPSDQSYDNDVDNDPQEEGDEPSVSESRGNEPECYPATELSLMSPLHQELSWESLLNGWLPLGRVTGQWAKSFLIMGG